MTRDARKTSWNDGDADDANGLDFFYPGSAEAGDVAPCPPPELVRASKAGVLPPSLQESVAAHVERCVVCQVLSEALDDPTVGGLTPEQNQRIIERVHAEIEKPKPHLAPGLSLASPVVPKRLWRWSAVAAGAALLVIASWVVWRAWSTRQPGGPPLSQVALDSRQPPSSGSVFQVRKAELPTSTTPELTHALEPYRADDFVEATRRLTALVNRDRQNATGHFYLGVSELLLNRNAEAVAALENAERFGKDEPGLRREASWYLAVAYRQTGRTDRVVARLSALCGAEGSRTDTACAGLRELSPITIFGTVTGRGGEPLAGALVGQIAFRFRPDFAVAYIGDVSVRTDDRGNFILPGVQGSVLRVSKAGYFTSSKLMTGLSQDARIDFVLNPFVHISLAQVVRGTLKPGDPSCAEPDPREICQHFALTVPDSGMLEVSLASTSPRMDWDLHVETPKGEAIGPYSRAPLPLRVTIPVERGSTYQIRVYNFSGQSRDFELTTRLQ